MPVISLNTVSIIGNIDPCGVIHKIAPDGSVYVDFVLILTRENGQYTNVRCECHDQPSMAMLRDKVPGDRLMVIGSLANHSWHESVFGVAVLTQTITSIWS